MNHKFTMSLSLNVLNHLGINLYSNIPAVLSEIVANSWDADATEVKINVDNDKITIEDNGCGMSADDINKKFLYVGHRKRENSLVSQSTIAHIWAEKVSENFLCFLYLKKLMFIPEKC